MSELNEILLKAQRHLARRDPVLKQLIATIGPCSMMNEPNRFVALAYSIVGQQISTKAANSIRTRLVETTGKAGLTPKAILDLSDEKLRGSGLSTNKTRSLRDLAEKVQSGSIPLDELHQLDDEEVIEHLLPVRGIGRWTAQMFLIFSLGRLDVLPVDDLGLRVGVQRQYGLHEPPAKGPLTERGEAWRPYRSIATWYFWRSLAVVPTSEPEA